MMNPGGPPPQTSLGQAQMVPPTPFPQIYTHVRLLIMQNGLQLFIH
jgi:hypothetical protein